MKNHNSSVFGDYFVKMINHILISKYNINKEIILNNELIIEYHNMIYDNTQYFNLFTNGQSIEYFSNFFEFIFENIEKNKYFKEIKILYSIFHNSLFNINKGNYKYLNNIQNLMIPINC